MLILAGKTLDPDAELQHILALADQEECDPCT
jgi:hypothetical protein